MSELLLGSSTWTFNGLLPYDLKSIVDGHVPCPAGQLPAVHAYFVELVTSILRSKIGAVELWYSEILADELIREQLERLTAVQRIVSMHAPFGVTLDLSSPDEGSRTAGVQACISAADLLSALGGRRLVVHGSNLVEDSAEIQERTENSVSSIREIADACGELNVEVAVELLPAPLVGSSAPELLAILELVDRPNVGICLDINHVTPQDSLLPTIFALADKLLTLHVSDYDGVVERHWLPGLGTIDWRALIQTLKEVGYEGPFMYEARFEAASLNDVASALEDNYSKIVMC